MKRSDTEKEKNDAEQVVRHVMSDQDAAQFSEALTNTPAPTAKAVEAASSFKDRVTKFD